MSLTDCLSSNQEAVLSREMMGMKVYRKQSGRRGIWIKKLLDYRFSRSDLLKACLILMPLGITYQPVKFYYTGPIWHQFAALERSRSFFTRQQADSFYNSPPPFQEAFLVSVPRAKLTIVGLTLHRRSQTANTAHFLHFLSITYVINRLNFF